MRRDDWVEQMWTTIEAAAQTPFAWGQHDCCLFAASVVDAMTDSAHVADLQTRYTDEATALAFIADEGGLESAVSGYLGEAKTGRPQRGDVVMFEGEQGDTIGVCTGRDLVAAGPDGLVIVPKNATVKFWSI